MADCLFKTCSTTIVKEQDGDYSKVISQVYAKKSLKEQKSFLNDSSPAVNRQKNGPEEDRTPDPLRAKQVLSQTELQALKSVMCYVFRVSKNSKKIST